MLPKDPFILLSLINMKLRDFYSDLDAYCDDIGESRAEIEENLGRIGFYYDINTNRFIDRR